ncbi:MULTISPECIES: ABC transporter ATP-binding protein [unclassified Leucobacter]|uniref:ATP-binding cassette domain-containing protein n=1 Tax=unclassified Leucobacter TaxID=2621730 RepID=UPI00165E6B80|nr:MULTISPECIES: ABC transporter ATP-binding protein [unclassified Leucobacter]MBC9926696.1 ABC transporter ATP-binding protein [Leucobacter sp. cx-169]
MSDLLRINELRVFADSQELLAGVDLHVAAGECVALVGDSGSGKSLIARAALGLLPAGLRAETSTHEVLGHDMRQAPERAWQRVRGVDAGYVHQDALGALDPLMRVGAQTAATLRRHHLGGRVERAAAAEASLARAGLSDAAIAARSWPHELSGGMRQRALIAGGLVASPRLLVADEPTTALDATVQRRVLEMLRAQLEEGNLGLLLVSHDLGAVGRIADRVLVVSGGRIVESGPPATLLRSPKHPTTIALLDAAKSAPHARPRYSDARGELPAIEARGLSVAHPGANGTAIAGVSFALAPGRTLGVLGESGAGKTSLAAALLGTRQAATGEVRLGGGAWSGLPERAKRPLRHRIQLVPQSAVASFSPGARVRAILCEALRARGGEAAGRPCSRARLRARCDELLAQVGLDPALARRRADTLSGGQAQRVAIARALATNPEVLVCDEAVSALDATARGRVLDLLERLQRETGVAMVFISHDVEAVRRVSDEVIVLRAGEVVEQGNATQVLGSPAHDFTLELLAAASLPARPENTR